MSLLRRSSCKDITPLGKRQSTSSDPTGHFLSRGSKEDEQDLLALSKIERDREEKNTLKKEVHEIYYQKHFLRVTAF